MRARELTDGSALIDAQAVSKKLCRGIRRTIVYAASDMGRELLGRPMRRAQLRAGEFWAVKEVDLRLAPGESLGIVGANGAGKTTLLRVLSGLIRPDEGRVTVRGRVAPLIALGAGFSPMLSGRENIRVNMALLGYPVRLLPKIEDAVIAFAELDDAIDSPLQTYSSGMYARLAFSCAVHADPDVVLLDEVLAVGDLRFRLKCYRKLGEMRKQGAAFVVVSHQPQTVLSICERALYLAKGRCIAAGNSADVMQHYERDQLGGSGQPISGEAQCWRYPARADHELTITEVSLRDAQGATLEAARSGEDTVMRVAYQAREAVQGCALSLAVQDAALDNERVLHLSSDHDGRRFDLAPGAGVLELALPKLGLRPGTYTAKVGMHRGMLDQLDVVDNLRWRVVSEQSMRENLFHQPRQWRIDS
jgi:lipopolysaccharide transport system ATP-binding protein